MSNLKNPKVSVVSITYNQEQYVSEMLESLLSQKTNFEYEIIVGDDASSDSTQSIINKYAKKYPKLIKPVLRNKNVGIQKNLLDVMGMAKGQYIALCEGDDYWTDINKLQKQVDFLDDNKSYALCFHPVKVLYEKGKGKNSIFPDKTSDFTFNELLRQNYIQTNSVLYRRLKDYEWTNEDIMPLDWYLHLYHAKTGKIGFINEVMSVYRRQENGVWWDAHEDIENLWRKNGVKQIALLNELRIMCSGDKKATEIILNNSAFLLERLIDIDNKDNTQVFEKITSKFPQIVAEYARGQLKNIRDLFIKNIDMAKDLEDIREEVELMKSTKLWQLQVRILKIQGIFTKNKDPKNKR